MKVLAFDPSGNYGKEGMGTSGFANSLDGYITKWGDIKSTDYDCRQAYWQAHEDLILQTYPDILVVESYRLFGHKSKQQTGSSLETPQLIGYMEMVAYKFKIPFILQDPSIKTRFADDVMLKLGMLEKKGNKFYFKGELTNMHMRDAIRHNLYYNRYGKKVAQ